MVADVCGGYAKGYKANLQGVFPSDRQSGALMPLTDTEIRKAEGAAKPYSLTDGSGLYLSVTPSGGKLWRWGIDTATKRSSCPMRSIPTCRF